MTPTATGRIPALTVLLPFLRPYRGRTAAAVAALLGSSALLLLLGQGVRHLIDTGFAAGQGGQLDRAALAMFGLIVLLAVLTTGRFYLMSWLGERVAGDLRRALFARALALPPSFYETMRTGDVLTRLTNDVGVLQALVGSSISMWVRSGLTLLGALALLVVTSPKLAALVVAVVPLVVLPLAIFSRRERRLSRAAQDRVADLGAYAEETLNAVATVQAFTHEPVDLARFATRIEQSVSTALGRVRMRAGLILTVILLGFGAITLSLWVGGHEVINNRLSGGDLSAFVFYAVLVASSGASMSELWGDVQRAAGAAERIGEMLAETPAIRPPARPRPLPPAGGTTPGARVAFEAVSFRYPSRPDTAALDRLDLRVEPGETVALVGPSGAGKTTVFQLLQRFHDPAAGHVRLDGADLRELDPHALRSRLGIVAQDPVIFGTDVWENIRYGRPGATNAEVRSAATAAHADFLHDLPAGFDTFLGEKGVRLSGGQRQRVAIARAVLRDPAVLLLDEATSALDAESEAAVQLALSVLARDRTTLVIAHRLATVRRADRIVVLEAGRVVATGTHDALVREGGLYARLARLQLA